MCAGVTAIAWGIAVWVFCHDTVNMVCLVPATSFRAPNRRSGFYILLVSWKGRMPLLKSALSLC